MQEELNNRKVSFKGVVLLLGSVLGAGIVIGGLASLISRFIYLILLFPIFMGFASGIVIKSVVVSQKIRSKFVVVIAGLIAAVIVYGSMHYFDYIHFRSTLAKEIQTEAIAEYGEPAPKDKVQAFIDYLLTEETGLSGFVGFILLEAKNGVSISHVGVGSSGSDLNLGAFTWVYWLVEMGIIAYGSIESAYKATQDLFCENCGTWVAQGDHIGGIQFESVNQAVEFIKSRDFIGLLGVLKNNTVIPSIEFYTRTCKTCSTFPFYLTGFAISAGNKGQTQSKLFTAQILNSSERFALTSEMKMPKAQ
ncbi:MAG: hypothetical protein IPP66_04920 [Anaerolineales bacterium]|nr:hypothetical protein [Anaerolineales bacterium]